MNWSFLEDEGYEVQLTKRKWKLIYNMRQMALINNPRVIAIGARKKSWPLKTIQDKAFPFAAADFVRRRVDSEQERPKIDPNDLREIAAKQLAGWLTTKMDDMMFKHLTGMP